MENENETKERIKKNKKDSKKIKNPKKITKIILLILICLIMILPATFLFLLLKNGFDEIKSTFCAIGLMIMILVGICICIGKIENSFKEKLD